MSDIEESDIDAWFAVEHDTVLSGVAKQDLYKALREIRRHRAAVAADKERIKAVVLDAVDRVGRDMFDLDERLGPTVLQTMAEYIATRAAEQLATAAVRLSTDEMDSLLAVRDLVNERAEYWHGKECGESYADAVAVLDRLIAAPHVGIVNAPPSTARIEAGLAKLGAEHEPPAGWEQQVEDATTIGLSLEEACLACDGLGVWTSDYNDAPEDAIGRLRTRLRAFIDMVTP